MLVATWTGTANASVNVWLLRRSSAPKLLVALLAVLQEEEEKEEITSLAASSLSLLSLFAQYRCSHIELARQAKAL